jgi:hypothetical protein
VRFVTSNDSSKLAVALLSGNAEARKAVGMKADANAEHQMAARQDIDERKNSVQAATVIWQQVERGNAPTGSVLIHTVRAPA